MFCKICIKESKNLRRIGMLDRNRITFSFLYWFIVKYTINVVNLVLTKSIKKCKCLYVLILIRFKNKTYEIDSDCYFKLVCYWCD